MSVQDFENQLTDYGFVVTGAVVADGKWHHHHIVGHKRGTRNGRYILNEQEGRLWGTYGDWKSGEWTNWKDSTDFPLASLTRAIASSAPSMSVPVDFGRVWNRATPADPAHPYLVRKGVRPFGIRQHRRQLLIPVRSIDGELRGLQRIFADGEKRFYKGTKKQSAFHRIGEWEDTILIAEGYATAGTCHMATRWCSIVAFDAGNLQYVGRVIRHAHPYERLIFVADDDDVGRKEASHAAEITRGSVIYTNDILKGIS